MLYSTSNKSTLCDPDSTFSYARHQRSFLVLESTHVPAQEKHHLSFSNPCVCQISNTSTIHLLPNASKRSKWQLLLDVRFVRLFLHSKTLLRSLIHNFTTALSQIKIFTKRLCLTVSLPVSSGALIKDFLNCGTTRFAACLMVDQNQDECSWQQDHVEIPDLEMLLSGSVPKMFGLPLYVIQ